MRLQKKIDEWDAGKIFNAVVKPANISMSVQRQLAAVVHAAIQAKVEDVIVNRATGWSAPMIGYRTEELEEMSDIPEVSRKCPFCEHEDSEHYDLSSHIAREHPKEAMKEYSDSIKFFFEYPWDTGVRHSDVTSIFAAPYSYDYESETHFCPFCERPQTERGMKAHVNKEHGAFMSVFYDVLKE